MGSATLGTNLIDGLVPMIDSLRASLNTAFGVRQWNVNIVRRHWTGAKRGDGARVVDSDVPLLPQPRVDFGVDRIDFGVENKMKPWGKDEEGSITLREVSLSYTEADLGVVPTSSTAELYYRLSDAQGQGIPNRYFVLAAPPVPDREKDIGWVVKLRRAEVQEP